MLDQIINDLGRRCIILWYVEDSWFIKGGNSDGVVQRGNSLKNLVLNKEVIIKGPDVKDLRHKFIYVPLPYTRHTQSLIAREIQVEGGKVG